MKEGFGNGAVLINLVWAPFFDPDYVRSLNLGAMWNCCEGSGLPRLDIRVWGHKGPV